MGEVTFEPKDTTCAMGIESITGEKFFVDTSKGFVIKDGFVEMKGTDLIFVSVPDETGKASPGFMKIQDVKGYEKAYLHLDTGTFLGEVPKKSNIGKTIISSRSGLIT